MLKINYTVFGFFVTVSLSLGLVNCNRQQTARTSITIKGSDTMVILGQRWAEEYMKTYPGVIVQITGGGSGTGIAALINGGTDICQSSRPMKEKEKEQVLQRQQKPVHEISVALDGVSVYLNQHNSRTEFTVEELKLIYTGKISNWQELGGNDKKIIAYSRENNSGTYMFFKEHVLSTEDFAAEVQTLPGTAAVMNAVLKDVNSIGYGGVAYHQGIRIAAVKKDKFSHGYEPSELNVRKGLYPLSRPLFFYVLDPIPAPVQKFIDWVLSPEGQKVCLEVGYFPLQ